MSPGMGKTTTSYAIYKILKSKGFVKRALVIAPLRVVYNVWPVQTQEWAEFQDLKVNILHGKDKEKNLQDLSADFYCVNPEGLPWLTGSKTINGRMTLDAARVKWIKENFDVLIVDECFPGNTLVLTPTGKVRIDSLKPGDDVETSVGIRYVRKVSTRIPSALLNLVLANGQRVQCTPEHPFFTDVGWVCAKDLHGRTILDRSNLSRMRREVGGEEEGVGAISSNLGEASRLLQILRTEENASRATPSSSYDVRDWKDERGKAKLEQRGALSGRDEREVVTCWEESEDRVPGYSRWQWDGYDKSGEPFITSIAYPIRVELSSVIGAEARRLSYALQAGLCGPGGHGWARGGWDVSQEATGTGSKEGREAAGTRVDRVENIERGNLSDVWNIEVEGCPNYFIGEGELLVHNCTKFKHTNTSRFKILRQFIRSFRRRYILTGTFSPNGLMDLFGQVYILDEGDALGSYVTHYKSKYFYPTDHMGYTFAPHSWAAEAIAGKIAPLCLVLDRKEHLDMPELMFNNIEVDLPLKVRAQYDMMEESLVALLDEGHIIAANAAVATSKCRQIANGGLYRTDGSKEWEDLHDEKLSALEDLLEEMSGEPLLIAYEFQFDLEKIQKKLNLPALGQGSQKRDSELIMAFNSGALPALLGHPASIALGLNLQGSCSNMCWYGLTWNLEQYLQTIDRVYRQGQKAANVIVHRIIAKDTLDERVLRVLDAKEKTQADFLTMLKEMRV